MTSCDQLDVAVDVWLEARVGVLSLSALADAQQVAPVTVELFHDPAFHVWGHRYDRVLGRHRGSVNCERASYGTSAAGSPIDRGSRKLASPSGPSSRPSPDSLNPPNGTSGNGG